MNNNSQNSSNKNNFFNSGKNQGDLILEASHIGKNIQREGHDMFDRNAEEKNALEMH